MAREDKRKVQKDIRSVVKKAKEAMYAWVVSIGYEPTPAEVRAWQAGYMAGLNKEDKS